MPEGQTFTSMPETGPYTEMPPSETVSDEAPAAASHTSTVGLIALVVTIVGVYLGFTKSIPFRHHYEVKAAFKTRNNMSKASPVRIAGVNVGKVTKVERGAEGGAGRAS